MRTLAKTVDKGPCSWSADEDGHPWPVAGVPVAARVAAPNPSWRASAKFSWCGSAVLRFLLQVRCAKTLTYTNVATKGL